MNMRMLWVFLVFQGLGCRFRDDPEDSQPKLDTSDSPDTSDSDTTIDTSDTDGTLDTSDTDAPVDPREPANLLENPSFEDGTDAPDGWTQQGDSAGTWLWSEDPVQSGSRSAGLTIAVNQAISWTQTVPVIPGHIYQLGGYVAFEQIMGTGSTNFQTIFYGADGGILEVIELPEHGGTRGMGYDYPPQIKFAAPMGAASAKVVLHLTGPGTAWFDDVTFGRAPTGSFAGTITSDGAPVEGARVRVFGDPWGLEFSAFTDQDGHYLINNLPAALPRYILMAAKDGYRTRSQGQLNIEEDHLTPVDFQLVQGADPTDDLYIAFAQLEAWKSADESDLIDRAVVPPLASDYPDYLQIQLGAGSVVDPDAPEIQDLVELIRSTIPPEDRTKTKAITDAIYSWMAQNIEYDTVFAENGVFLDVPWADITTAIWQSTTDEGWAWGTDYLDWLVDPVELLDVRCGLCSEHAGLATALLRGFNIPARSEGGVSEFWTQAPEGDSGWHEWAPFAGRVSWRQSGQLEAEYDLHRITYYSVDADPAPQGNFLSTNGTLWRETHPLDVWYSFDETGLARAMADLEILNQTGERPEPNSRVGSAITYKTRYRDIEIRLLDMIDQRTIEVEFPHIGDSDYHIAYDNFASWTNHPECLVDEWVEEKSDPYGDETIYMHHFTFDVSSLIPE